jgi:hypothetical protein
MNRLVIPKQEEWVGDGKGRGWMFEILKDRAAIDIVQKNVKLIRLVVKAPVVNENILDASTALLLIGHMDWQTRRFLQCVGWRRDRAS